MALIQADAPSPNFFLDGNFSPVAEERDAEGMEVIGAIPTKICRALSAGGPQSGSCLQRRGVSHLRWRRHDPRHRVQSGHCALPKPLHRE